MQTSARTGRGRVGGGSPSTSACAREEGMRQGVGPRRRAAPDRIARWRMRTSSHGIPMSASSGRLRRAPRAARRWRRAALALAVVPLVACGRGDVEAGARGLLEQGRVAEASRVLQAELEARPGNASLYQLYGVALLRSGRPSLAVWPLRRAAADPQHAVESGLLLAQALLTGGSPQGAVGAADAVLARDPDNTPALALRAQAHLRSLHEEEALADIETLLTRDAADASETLALLQAKLEAELRLGRATDAERTIARLQTRAGASDALPEGLAARLCALSAVFTAETGETQAAREKHEACLASYPAARIVIEEAARFFDGLREFDRGSEILERAMREAPDDLAIRVQYAKRLRDLDRADEAERVLREFAERNDTPLAWTSLADHFVEVEDLRGAADALEHAVALQTSRKLDEGGFDDVPDAGLFAYADILVQLGEQEHERVQRIIQALDEPAYAYFLEGRMQLERGDYRAADAAYRAGLRLWPSNPGARYLAAQAAEQLGDFDAAITHYREALRADASRTPAGLALARVQRAQGNLGAAFDALRYHLRGHRDDARALMLYGDLAAEMGRDEDAAAARRRLATLPGHAGAAVARRARDLERLRGVAAGVAFIETSQLDLGDPAHCDALDAWAALLHLQSRDAKALARIDAALAAAPQAAALHAVRGAALRRMGRSAEARAALERALSHDPRSLRALVELAALSAAEGQRDAAVALYDRAAAVDPAAPEHAYAAALLRLGDGDAADAQARFEALLRAFPWHADAAYQLALAAEARGELGPRALDFAQRAARFRPGAEGIAVLGRILLARGDAEQAVAVLRHAVALPSSGPSDRYQLGRALAAVGDREAAREAFRVALDSESFPEMEDARVALARLGGSSSAE
jgi:predicted Zn-dependent protease